MNKLIRLSPTGIEYGDYAWNFASGCGNNIDGKCKSGSFKCWAYSISQRFEGHYPNGFKPTIYPESFCSPLYLKKPSRILCAFMGDLFGDCPEFNPDEKIEALMPSGKVSIAMSLKGWIYTTIKQCPRHTFLFLTKQPQNLIKFSPFPDNAWVGVTATDQEKLYWAVEELVQIEAKIKYLSLEPLLEWVSPTGWLINGLSRFLKWGGIKWVIIGACTGNIKDLQKLAFEHKGTHLIRQAPKWTLQPKIEWVAEIIEAADKAGIPVFLKNNLRPIIPEQEPLFNKAPHLIRQEMPNVS